MSGTFDADQHKAFLPEPISKTAFGQRLDKYSLKMEPIERKGAAAFKGAKLSKMEPGPRKRRAPT